MITKPSNPPKRVKRAAKVPAKSAAPARKTVRRDAISTVPSPVPKTVTPTGRGAVSRMHKFGHLDATTYRREFAANLIDYFAVEPTWVETFSRDVGKRKVVTQRVHVTELPTMAGFAAKLGISKHVLDIWARRHSEFANAMDIARTHQERILITNGLFGRYNNSFATMAAKNLIGWRDKFDVELSGDVTVTLKTFAVNHEGVVIEAQGDSVGEVIDVTPRIVSE